MIPAVTVTSLPNTCQRQHRISPEAVVVPDLYAQVCRKHGRSNYLGHVSSYDITLFWIRCIHPNPGFVSVCMWAHEYTCMYAHMCRGEQRKVSGVVLQVQSDHCCFVCLLGVGGGGGVFCLFCSVWGRFSHWPGACRLGWLASEPRGSTVSTYTGWELLHCPQQGTKMNPSSLKLLVVEQVSGHSE